MTRAAIGILGGGISGIALAASLGPEVEVLEKSEHIGGLCGTIRQDGFVFDAAGPHIMFSRNRDVLALMVEVLGENVHQRRRDNKIWFKGRLVKYPFENDLAALPKEDNFECIYRYLENPHAGIEPRNLAEWSYKTFGEGISNLYFLPYNRKIWNYDPASLGLEFVARIPKPPMADVLKSSIGIPTEGYLHQLHFYYPIEGGYEELVHAFARRIGGSLQTSWPIVEVERIPEGWQVTSARGERRTYETLVSTLPIHELVKVWKGAPAELSSMVARLRYNSLINVCIGLHEDRGYPWTALYVPDEKILFHRLSFPKAFSERCVPEGSFSLMAEITANEGDGVWELGDEEILRRTTEQLAQMELIDPASIIYRKVIRFSYGYPVYDLDYRTNVTAMRELVASTGLHLLGRFAQFDYINSDVCIERALDLAGRLGAAGVRDPGAPPAHAPSA